MAEILIEQCDLCKPGTRLHTFLTASPLVPKEWTVRIGHPVTQAQHQFFVVFLRVANVAHCRWFDLPDIWINEFNEGIVGREVHLYLLLQAAYEQADTVERGQPIPMSQALLPAVDHTTGQVTFTFKRED